MQNRIKERERERERERDSRGNGRWRLGGDQWWEVDEIERDLVSEFREKPEREKEREREREIEDVSALVF